ncbi:hypothetical protein UFOVP1298_56 [uncultured Caudovirales phage]|jgi:hypothetical protein|uniref:Uncharacterized protein n=1 Tax=uncultured Caudovirales phage TaxID=2100421 RepID=A0A6J5RUM5_9CAUD|nr:hypothetical protein UFOVP1298_56 [uncultured Caudovirales phage]
MDLEEEMHDVDKRMTAHEAVCAERWRETILRIKRIEGILISVAGALLLMLANIAYKLH